MPTQNGQGRCRVLLPCGCKLEGTCLLLVGDRRLVACGCGCPATYR